MLSPFLSPFFLRIYAGIALVVAILFGLRYIYSNGYDTGWGDRDKDMQAEIIRLNNETSKKEKSAKSAIDKSEKELKDAKDEIERKRVALHNLSKSGGLRLPATSCIPTPESAGSSPVPERADASELERQTISSLIDIVTDGDIAIKKYNQCVKLYNEVKEAINGNAGTPSKDEDKQPVAGPSEPGI